MKSLKGKISKKRKGKGDKIAILTDKTDFSVTEAYKSIRTNLTFAVRKKGCKPIIITSAEPNEGKSTNCCNLGITLAQTESSVLIIDCDLRKPDMHRYFKLKGIPGLSEVLAGMNEVSEVIQQTEHPNLKVLCGGTIPPNPAELLGSDAMDELLNVLSLEFDYILLDTPPVNVVTDALVLSPKTQGAVLIVRQGRTTHPELKRALSSLKFAEAKILGVIMNGVEKHPGHHNYYYQSGI